MLRLLPIIFIMTLSNVLLSQEEYKYLFLGHTYDSSRTGKNKVDRRIEEMDLSKYHGIWLGGDITADPFVNLTTNKYLDSLFNLTNPHSHYVLGNHDARNLNLDLYYNLTKRPDFYTHTFKNLTLSVLNTNLSQTDCEPLEKQYRMLTNVLDTISNSSHYVILMHHQIFESKEIVAGFKSHGALRYYNMNCGSAQSSFWDLIYPRLVEIHKRGVKPIIVVGDTGWDKGREVETSEGVVFLASGINNSFFRNKEGIKQENINRDKILEFTFEPKRRSLIWKFIELDEYWKN